MLLLGVNTNEVIMVQQGLFHESFPKPTFPHVGQWYDTLLVLVIKCLIPKWDACLHKGINVLGLINIRGGLYVCAHV